MLINRDFVIYKKSVRIKFWYQQLMIVELLMRKLFTIDGLRIDSSGRRIQNNDR